MRERWWADDYELTQGIVRDVELRAGQMRTPPVVGSNAEIPNRTGEQWVPKRHGPGTVVLAVWTGTDSGRVAVEALYAELLRAVVQPHRLVRWTRQLPDGSRRSAYGEVVTAIDPIPIGQQAYRFAIEVRIPGAYFYSDTEHSMSTGKATAALDPLDLHDFADSSATMETLRLQVKGPITGLRITDLSYRGIGGWLSYNNTVPGGKSILFNAGTWEVTGDGFTPSLGDVTYSGPRLLALAAPPPGYSPRIQMSAGSTGTGTQLTVIGSSAYLC